MYRIVALALLLVALIAPPAHAQQGKDTLRLETTKGNIVIRLTRRRPIPTRDHA
jgi:hypothetical protein